MLGDDNQSLGEILLSDVHNFVTETGISATALSERATGDGAVISRLRGGASVTLRTADKLYAFMREERARRAGEAAETAARLGGNGAGDTP